MKRSTKWFLPLVVLAMVLFLAPMQAGAAQTQEPVGMEMPFRVNPLYADVVDEAELETEFDLTAVPMPMEAPVYLTEEEAVESLRQNLVARNETFTVYLDSDTDDIAALAEELFDAAMEHTGEPAQGDYLLWQYAGCGGGVSYTPGTTKYTLIYQVTYYTTAAQEAEMDTAVASVLTELSLDGKSDYEKIKAIYDYICANVEYDYDHLNDSSYTLKCTAYAALINKTAVCQGYAGLLYRLALEAGVDCRMITGTGNGGGHAWNIVKLDGKYYNVDATWDAGETEYTYFLRCGDNFDDHTRNSAYDTGAFHTAYPMAEADYVPKTYIASGTCGENAAWALDDEGTLTISGQGAMADYSLAGAPWYSYSSSDIRQIVVEGGITKIGDSAFCGCTGLTGVTLPDSLTAIGWEAFSGCTALEEINIPTSVTSIDTYAFSGCTALTEIELPDGMTALNSYVFYGCSDLTTVVLPRTLKTIGRSAFASCGMTYFVVGENVSTINAQAFQNGTNLEAIYFLGDAPETVGSNAFQDCSATVYYPAGASGWEGDTWQGLNAESWTYEHSSTETCTQGGVETITSEAHDLTYTRTVLPLGHIYGEWKLTTPATTESTGLWTRYCGGCELYETREIPKLTATAQTPAATNNQADQNYKQASATVKSYLYENGDGTFARVEYAGDYVSVETYDGDFNFLSRIGLDMELPIFGGFYSGCEDYNFLVFGQNNTAESGSTEVVRVVCYTKDWQRAGSASLYGANTTYPFSAGSLRFAHCGDMLYVRTCHKMYTNALDGLIHQANMTFSVRISDMTMTDGLVGVSNKDYGYVSHSFNQFIQVDGTDLLAVDHGDAYPRSVILTKYKKPAGQDSFTGSCTYVQVLPFTGATGNNSTGASVGGFEISGTHYLVAGNSIVQDGTVSLTVGQRNIFITATDKSDFTSAGTQIYWLTSYADGSGVSVSTPQLVKISGEKLCILWTEGTTLRYAFLDGSGKLIGQIYSAEGALSDCEPIVADGKICWYVTTGSVPFFYTIDLSQPETVSKVHGHCYTYSITVTPTEEADGKLEGKCAYCEEKDEVTLPAISEADYTREVVTAAGCTTTGSAHYTWKDTSCGTVTFDVTLPVLGHSYSVEVTDPSCTAGGYTTYTCTTCGDTYTDGKTSSLGHSYEAVVTAPTCTKGGYTTHTCGDCGDTYIDSKTPALGHSYGDWVTVQESTCTETGLAMRKCIRGDAYQKQILEPIAHSYSTVITAPTCAEGGYTTHTCGGCGDTYIDSETPAKGHSYGNWIVDKAATTTEEGEEHRVCGTCGDIQTRKIPSIVHSYDSVVTAPTCTGRGYTTHTCSHCGDVYIDSYVNALGHNYSSVVTAPTCTAGGYTTHTCGTCGDTYTDAETSALGHSYTSKVTLPTCTAGGYTTYTCGSCGDTYTGSETAALGHKYEETVVKPTYSAAGSITNRCSVCGDTKVEALSQLPNPFADVKEENFFYTPVLWALDNEITNGMDDTHFGPKGDCTRGQVVTFLWRAAGSPEPTSADNPFADVSEGRFYYTAVLWAVENGITNGTGDTTFSPNESCTRGQVVTFLWRFRGEPAPSSGTTAFTDVTPNQFCAKAVAWAVENGITNGINATTFGPKDVCTRSQVVTFLYRAVN